MAYKSPVYHVIPVPIEKVRPNTYNPNAVAPPEMRLLYESIRADGYTMPIVCYYAKSQDIYVIVDGFHRYRVMLEHPDIYEREGGVLPVSVIDKPLDQRMASTIRHNRARGSHDVDLMSNIVKELHELGRSDAWIAKHLGMDKDELLRLKQITGLTALFKDVKFGQAWQPMDEEDGDESENGDDALLGGGLPLCPGARRGPNGKTPALVAVRLHFAARNRAGRSSAPPGPMFCRSRHGCAAPGPQRQNPGALCLLS